MDSRPCSCRTLFQYYTPKILAYSFISLKEKATCQIPLCYIAIYVIRKVEEVEEDAERMQEEEEEEDGAAEATEWRSDTSIPQVRVQTVSEPSSLGSGLRIRLFFYGSGFDLNLT